MIEEDDVEDEEEFEDEEKGVEAGEDEYDGEEEDSLLDYGRFEMNEDVDWIKQLESVSSVTEGMMALYNADKETFYIHGEHIRKMLELRFALFESLKETSP